MPEYKQRQSVSTAITITLGNLANLAARQSLAVDNATDNFPDAFVRLKFVLVAGVPASNKCVNLYAYGSEDGIEFGDNATGADAVLTMRSPTNLILLKSIATPDSGGLTYRSGPVAVAGAFGGMFLPRKWGIICENLTGLAFAATGNAASYSGLYLGS